MAARRAASAWRFRMASIIRAAGPHRVSESGTFNLDDLSDKARRWIDQVRGEAGEILAHAEKEAAAVRAKAEEQGRQAAIEAAERVLDQKVGKQLETLLPALQKAVAGIVEARADFLRGWERNIVHLATAIAARVIRREVERQPDLPLALVREALDLAAGSPHVQLQLHPADLAALGAQVERLTKETSRLGNVEIVADPQVSQGGCRVLTRHGAIDERVESQLVRIEEELTAS